MISIILLLQFHLFGDCVEIIDQNLVDPWHVFLFIDLLEELCEVHDAGFVFGVSVIKKFERREIKMVK